MTVHGHALTGGGTMTRRRRHHYPPEAARLKNFNDFETAITRDPDVLRGFDGRRWKALTLSFPTTLLLTHFDLKNVELWLIRIEVFLCRLRRNSHEVLVKFIENR